jgi:hypothetical protein
LYGRHVIHGNAIAQNNQMYKLFFLNG